MGWFLRAPRGNDKVSGKSRTGLLQEEGPFLDGMTTPRKASKLFLSEGLKGIYSTGSDTVLSKRLSMFLYPPGTMLNLGRPHKSSALKPHMLEMEKGKEDAGSFKNTIPLPPVGDPIVPTPSAGSWH